jgi:D-beta-D-heptose 7-phosphate kinase/D-beta-D-heptose 1-phosphate adenosyltransferase
MNIDLEILSNFSKVKILVVGDVMLDRYWWGSVNRISPEAPVPVMHLSDVTLAAGGAANVAVNIAGLGAEARLLGVTGADSESGELSNVLEASGVSSRLLRPLPTRPTTVKTRLVAHEQHIVRVDNESTLPLQPDESAAVKEAAALTIAECDAVVISDYAKGLLSESLTQSLIAECKALGKPVLVDPKGSDYSKYAGATILTPNRVEAEAAAKIPASDEESLNAAGHSLLNNIALDALLITRGADGMTLFQKDKPPLNVPTYARQVFDVTGAGDTVIAALSTALAAGMSLENAVRLSNIAAGAVVEEVGTTAISSAKLHSCIQRHMGQAES